ncbi:MULTISPECIES: SDR family oxidoreductase [unclassified Streptomyces]|uniref:SDR family oxidoreductase n=1 Tax=unclassified Streptomyces TaxID=2593676 RepID=UPI000F46A268|nr:MULTISPECIES: SDR family oxidoreductase [unclassified Streptomyces]MCX4774395.1 SDR family oxidoreductase [Streptomyces sp. NBC_01285]ROQ73126.1 NAD(P)-dependent dehydrogenase (short-subunit alcohol dehydrogenase family) [Streptomyces sp. CEV 2-1]
MSTGRRVVVTAGAGGIGLVIAKTFAGNGDRVHICDVNEGALAKIDDENESITTTVCDVSDRSSVEAFVRIAADTLGGIDVLVNNAGISGPTASVEEMDPDQWDAVLAVNLTGTFNVTRLSIPFLRQSGSGVIINMSSVGGRFGYPSRSPYATTKRGLLGLTETLALELGEAGIRVNAIAPGAVDGERIQRVLRNRAETTGRSLEEVTVDALSIQALKRFVDPADIAAPALFLASDSARSITGQTIPIDGGSKSAQ